MPHIEKDFELTPTQQAPTERPGQIADARPACFHCGAPCPDASLAIGDKLFCCAGCRSVFEILDAGGLQQFYTFAQTPGVRPQAEQRAERFAFLNDAELRKRLLDFSDGKRARVTFHAPAIHCAACVWLLENLFRLHPGIGRSEVNFPRRQVAIQFDETQTTLGDVAALLASCGYEPKLNLGSAEEPVKDPTARRLALRIGVAGFAFGNIMLLSFPSYLGLNPATEGLLQRFFGWFSLGLALPVLLYSASDYWAAAWRGIRRRMLTIDFPIALGIAALFAQSVWDILLRRGEGYLDSFAGLIFLLLCGQWFQRKTFEQLSFDRDYKSYFPLAVLRKTDEGEAAVPVKNIEVGDRIIIRNEEIIPADAVLISASASVDYSFVTGEPLPIARERGDRLYAGGRQHGGAIELEVVKNVSQSYLVSLWNNEAFNKSNRSDFHSLSNIAGRYFTLGVVIIAACVAVFWSFHDPTRLVRAFCSVLLVACPCALALAAPYTLGSALRVFGRQGFYLRNAGVVENLAKADTVVFDKTGTLTSASEHEVSFQGGVLNDDERRAAAALASHSTHPISRAIAAGFAPDQSVENFIEVAGSGVQGRIRGRLYQLGSRAWLNARGDDMAATYLAVDGEARGRFVLKSAYRPALGRVMQSLAKKFNLAIVSGDHAGEEGALGALCGAPIEMRFRQSPFDKLDFVRRLQSDGKRVLMVGDGLNDAGALKQSDVGIALTEDVASFSPSCDGILDARAFGRLMDYIRFSRASIRVLKTAFVISIMYNLIAVGIAASGHLSPVISAILMPISSFSVMAFSVGATHGAARWMGIR